MDANSAGISFIVIVTLNLILAPASFADNLQILKKEFLKGYKYTQERSPKQDKALRHFRKVRDLDVAMRDYILFYLGRALRDQKECEEARQAFRELAENYPESRWVPLAALQANAAEDCPPLALQPLSEERWGCEEVPSPVEKADCFFRSKSYRKAKELYKTLSRQDRGRGGQGIFYLTRLSQAAARSQDFDTAIRANETIRSRYPDIEAAREAHRKTAFLYQDAGDYRRAIPVLRELLEKGRTPQERRLYQERIGWCHFRLEQYAEAVDSFDAALRENEAPFSLYWKGRSLERMGEKDRAHELFHNLTDIYRGSYYGVRALERLYGQAPPPSVLREWWNPSHLRWEKETESVEESPALQRIYELASLGLFHDAEIEVRRVRGRLRIPLPPDPKKIKKGREGFFFEARHLEAEHPDYMIPYADFTFSGIHKTAVDPFLLYAMMRQESRFRDSVVSPAGAVGILQIMPGTGRRLAKEAGWSDYQPDWLYDPVTNIELAVKYIKKLSDLFDGKWYAIAASYNAGEHVVKEWVAQRKGLPEEEFIEEIPYSETRDYVKKVYTNWRAYRFIYGAD